MRFNMSTDEKTMDGDPAPVVSLEEVSVSTIGGHIIDRANMPQMSFVFMTRTRPTHLSSVLEYRP